MGSKYHGKGGVVYASTSASGAATKVISLTRWSLDMPTDRVETTDFDSSNKEYVQGFKDVSGEIAGFWNDGEDKLFAGADSADGVKLYLYPSKNAPSKYFYGPAWLDASIEVGVDAAVSISGSFAANGAWGRV